MMLAPGETRGKQPKGKHLAPCSAGIPARAFAQHAGRRILNAFHAFRERDHTSPPPPSA